MTSVVTELSSEMTFSSLLPPIICYSSFQATSSYEIFPEDANLFWLFPSSNSQPP